MTVPSIHQTVIGDHNIFTGAGDVRVTYELAPAEGEDRHNLLTLLDSVKRFWIDDRLEGSIHKDVSLALSMKTLPEAIDHPWKMILGLPDQASRQIPQDKNIGEVFVETGRLLLILGEPGSGKTTTLLQLARSLIEAARIDPTKPIPVVFHLSSWTEKREAMLDWLVEELRTKYYIPSRLGRSFLMSNRVLPLLDGLDEVTVRYQSACVESINHFAREVGIPGIVVCSRFNDYTALPQRLKVNGAVYLQQLTFEQIDDYMSGVGDRLAALRSLVQEDTVLQTLAGSPLMLDVMVSAYQDTTIDALKNDKLNTTEGRRENVFQTYAERMFQRRSKDSQPYTQEQTTLWISWLARNMIVHSQSIFLVERMQPSWLLNRGELMTYILASRLALGLIIGLAFSLERLLDVEQPFAERLGFLFCSISAGLILGTFAYFLKAKQTVISNQAHDQKPSRWRLGLHVMIYAVVAGLIGSLIGGFVGRLWLTLYVNSASPNSDSHGLAAAWFAVITASPTLPMWAKSVAFMLGCGFRGFVFGLVYGLFFGVIVGVREKQRSFGDDIQTAETLTWSFARARKAVKWVTWRVLFIGLLSGAVPFPFLILFYLLQILIANNRGVLTPPSLVRIVVVPIAIALLHSLWLFVGFSILLLITFGGLAAGWGGLNTSPRLFRSKDLTNRGIKTSLKNSMWAAIIAAASIVFISLIWVFVGFWLHRAIPALPYGPIASQLILKYLLILVVWGMVAGLWYAGADIIKHYTLRLILFCKGNAPRRFDTFLAYAVKLGLIQKVGGGYIFVHLLLRDYFAGRVASPGKA